MKTGVSLVLLFVAALLCQVGAECPLGCSDHGECSTDSEGDTKCFCDLYYGGDDCSLYTYPLTPLVPVSGDVAQSEWEYFTLDSYGSDQSWVLTIDNDGDCDLYINFNSYPSRYEYLFRNQSTLPELTLSLKDQPFGVYYGGVYGFSQCSFRIRASNCGPCGEHGSCFDGQCLCDQGYGGKECLNNMTKVEAHGNIYETSAMAGEWTYFYFESDQDYSEVDWIVESQYHKAMTLAFREDETPTFWNNDYIIEWWGFSHKAFINQTNAQKGKTYYFGALGGKKCLDGYCDFTLRLEVTTPLSCPNACSLHHSSCLGNGCICLAGYSGVECEEYDLDAELGVTYTGYVGDNAWNYYHIEGNTRTSYVVDLNLTSSRGECDLYVNGGSKPTLREFNYLSTSSPRNPAQVVIPNPIGETWYIGIYGKAPCTYDMRIQETTTCGCAPNPDGHGYCETNSTICVCNFGWVGDDCSEPVNEIMSGVPVRNESVTKEEWKYYYINAEGSSAFSVTLKELNTTGYIWLFISHSEYPTLDSYDYSDKSSESPIHEVTFFTREPQTGSIYIGVLGSPFIPEHTPTGEVVKIPYDLEAWAATF